MIGPLLAPGAIAGPATTRDALDRVGELLQLRIDDGLLAPEQVVPAMVVSLQPRYEESAPWFATSALEVLTGVLGDEGLRVCEACMAPRAFVEQGSMAWGTGPVGVDEILRLDEQRRGDAVPARAAIWLDEHRGGVALRIVDLHNGRVLFAQNVDPTLTEYRNTQRIYTLSAELERRAQGDGLTQAFVDLALYPGQHVSLDWTDQWGKTNANLSGVTLSVVDPILGIGACHHRRIEPLNATIGAKLIVSLPSAVVAAVGQDGDTDILDPLVTAVAMGRVPFGRSNYGAVIGVSTNGQIGIGVSLLNISLLPVLP